MIAPNLQTLSGAVLPGVFMWVDLARAPFLSVQSVCFCSAAALDLAPKRVIYSIYVYGLTVYHATAREGF